LSKKSLLQYSRKKNKKKIFFGKKNIVFFPHKKGNIVFFLIKNIDFFSHKKSMREKYKS